jgi:hypothetical protein
MIVNCNYMVCETTRFNTTIRHMLVTTTRLSYCWQQNKINFSCLSAPCTERICDLNMSSMNVLQQLNVSYKAKTCYENHTLGT